MTSENKMQSERDRLRQQRNSEIDFLQNLRINLLQAKQQLNNDLTELAIKNLPMMEATVDEQQGTEFKQTIATETFTTESTEQLDIQQLEPLDLDI